MARDTRGAAGTWLDRSRMRISVAIGLLVVVHATASCASPPAPSAPTGPATPAAPAPAPTVTSLSPTLGSTGGATEVKILGAALGARVLFGGVAVDGRFDSRYPGALMLLDTPPHATGTVDVVVSGRDGSSVTLAGAFTYAPPQSFDFNGRWSGFGRNGQDNLIRFTIQDNQLLGVSCDSLTAAPDAVITFSPPRAAIDGAFSVAGDGIAFTGRIVSPSAAAGTIRLGECASDGWYAVRE
jgi:IPT/TIG domain-containing protein